MDCDVHDVRTPRRPDAPHLKSNICSTLIRCPNACTSPPSTHWDPPHGPSKDKPYEGRRLVLIRLVWRTHTEIRPGVALHSDQGRICVEWTPTRGVTRYTWRPEADVRPRLKYQS